MSYHARRAYHSSTRATRRGPSRRIRHTGDTTVDLITNRSSMNGTRRRPSSRKTTRNAPLGKASGRIEERNQRIRFALERLPEPRDRAIVMMRFFLGLRLRQIATKLRLGLPEVRDSYRLSLRILEKELQAWLE